MRVLWISVLAAIISIAVFAWTIHVRGNDQAQLARVANETHSALCAFKNDLERRYEDSAAFLENHPNGIPGISAADIQRSLLNQKATLISLRALDCS